MFPPTLKEIRIVAMLGMQVSNMINVLANMITGRSHWGIFAVTAFLAVIVLLCFYEEAVDAIKKS